jgi:hypothetical protein
MRHMPRPAPVPYWDSGYYAKAARRASAMTADAICGWIGTAVSGMYKAMQDFRRDGQPESLLEMQEGLTAAYALLAELRRRRDRETGCAR